MVKATSQPLHPPETTPVPINCIGGGVGPRADLDGGGICRPNRDFFFFCILVYSVLHPCLFRCLDCPAFFLYLQHTTQTSMPAARFENATPASDRQQTLALHRSAIGNGRIPIPDLPAGSKSLYRLSYPSPHQKEGKTEISRSLLMEVRSKAYHIASVKKNRGSGLI